MGPKKTVKFKGRETTGQSVDFESPAELWTTYKLEDGTVLRLKTVLLDVTRVDEYNDNGDPVYMFSAQQIVNTSVPDLLKKKKG